MISEEKNWGSKAVMGNIGSPPFENETVMIGYVV